MPENSLLALFIVGLLGGGHCAGMCGGIVGALSMQSPQGRASARVHLAYNLGRIASYTLAGLLAGAVGFAAGDSAVKRFAVEKGSVRAL